jgi:uncharacterized membrane protein YhaH (DUF805 family)
MPEAGWYDDPDDATQLRWWDGSRWSDERRPREDVPPPPPPTSSVPAPAGTAAPSVPPAPSAWDTASTAGWGSAGSGAGFGAGAGASGDAPWPAPPRSFWDAVKVCLTKYVDGKGRASRSEYWYFALFTFLVGLVTGGVGDLLLLLPSITVSVRRLHDIGKSAWALLWVLLPVIGWIVLIVYAVRPGEPNPNVYG